MVKKRVPHLEGTIGLATLQNLEPALWAMMIIGFLGLGFLAYRRNGLSFS
jgi:hypothetical protein